MLCILHASIRPSMCLRLYAGLSRATAGPGKPLSQSPITTSFRRCRDRDTEGGIKGEETWEGSPLTIWLGICESIVSSATGSVAEPQLKMDFMHISGRKEAIWNTLFGIFERWWASQMLRGPGKLSPLSSSWRAWLYVFHDISSIYQWIFARLLSLMHLGRKMNWLGFGFERSKFKVALHRRRPALDAAVEFRFLVFSSIHCAGKVNIDTVKSDIDGVKIRSLCNVVDAVLIVEGFQSWMWKGLTFLLPFLIIGYVRTSFI